MIRPDRATFRDLARDHTVVPVWRELLADLVTPVAAFARLCPGDEPGFLLESVEHGERWGRWSFVGRRPVASLVARGARGHGRGARARWPSPADLPARRGHPRRRRGPAGPHPHPRGPRPAAAARRPRSATWATTWSARWSTCPTSRPTSWACPTPPCRSSASSPPSTTGASGSPWWPTPRWPGARRRRRARRGLRRGLRPPRRAGPRRRPAPRRAAARAARPRRRAARGHLDPRRRRLRAGGRGGQGAHPGRRHLPGRAVPALRPRPRRRPLRRLPGPAPAQPQPVDVLRAPARGVPRRVLPRADGAAARRAGDLPAHRRHPLPGPHRGGGPSPRAPSSSSTPRRSPST